MCRRSLNRYPVFDVGVLLVVMISDMFGAQLPRISALFSTVQLAVRWLINQLLAKTAPEMVVPFFAKMLRNAFGFALRALAGDEVLHVQVFDEILLFVPNGPADVTPPHLLQRVLRILMPLPVVSTA
jgi:hypothetical protein